MAINFFSFACIVIILNEPLHRFTKSLANGRECELRAAIKAFEFGIVRRFFKLAVGLRGVIHDVVVKPDRIGDMLHHLSDADFVGGVHRENEGTRASTAPSAPSAPSA